MSRPRAALLAFAIVAVLFASAVTALGAEVILSPDEKATCEANGGCRVMMMGSVREAIAAAFKDGMAKGAAGCFKSTT